MPANKLRTWPWDSRLSRDLATWTWPMKLTLNFVTSLNSNNTLDSSISSLIIALRVTFVVGSRELRTQWKTCCRSRFLFWVRNHFMALYVIKYIVRVVEEYVGKKYPSFDEIRQFRFKLLYGGDHHWLVLRVTTWIWRILNKGLPFGGRGKVLNMVLGTCNVQNIDLEH